MTAKMYIKDWTYDGFTWDNCLEIPFFDYEITESDFRNKTMKFTSPRALEVGKRSRAIKIVNDDHETFSGIILKREDDIQEPCTYQCQDFNRLYMTKPSVNKKDKVYNLIKLLLNYCGNSQYVWKGLLSKNKYEQGKYGSVFSFNPMKNVLYLNSSDKTVKELIEQLVYSQKPYIDIHYNNTGIMKFSPYHIDKWMQPVAKFHYNECIDWDYSFDTTNIVTQVVIGNTIYKYSKLFNSKYNQLLNFVSTGISLNGKSQSTNSGGTSTNKSSSKTSSTNDKTSNPYHTKNKEVWVNMDICWGHSSDNSYLNTFCAELRKLGWKVHNLGVGPAIHTNYSKASNCKNGIWLTIDNGVDCEVFRHFGHDTWFKGQLVRNNSRAVLAFINDAGNIKKGGKYFKYLGMAHDGTGNGSPGLKYPAGYLAACGVPFFYSFGRHPKAAARLFNSGGDSKLACENDYKKHVHGYYHNWNWGSKY
jgi:hypothetical protein